MLSDQHILSNNSIKEKNLNKIKKSSFQGIFIGTVLLCAVPLLVYLVDLDFGISTLVEKKITFSYASEAIEKHYQLTTRHLLHASLDFSIFCFAILIVMLAFFTYKVKRKQIILIIAIEFFCFAIIDGAKLLISSGIIHSSSHNINFIPLSWVLCQIFIAIIMFFIAYVLISKRSSYIVTTRFSIFVFILWLISGYATIIWFKTNNQLPQAIFENSLIVRPYSIIALFMFITIGLLNFKIFTNQPCIFTYALLMNVIPVIALELYMVFGLLENWNNYFVTVYFLKIFSYSILFAGLFFDYIKTYKNEKNINRKLAVAKMDLFKYTSRLEETIKQRTSELKEKQNQLVQSEKMASVGLLAAGVAHEINNPIGFIMGNMEILQEYKNSIQHIFKQYSILENCIYRKSDEQLKKIVAKIKSEKKENDLDYIVNDLDSLTSDSLKGTKRIKKIVNDLKSFSRADDGEPKTIDLNNDVIEQAIRLVWNELKYKCTIRKSLGYIPPYTCHPTELSQVIMNILVNASDSIKEEGYITITSFCKDSNINIYITDTGSGIDKNNMVKIFDPFFTTKDIGKGTGLGLSISQGLIEKQKGKILVSSKRGEGTTFKLVLPLLN